MPSNRWLGRAKAVAQITTFTLVYDAASTYSVTVNGKTISQAATVDAATTATNLQAALAASTEPEFVEITWSVNGAVITATAATPGVPFLLSTSVAGGAGTATVAGTLATPTNAAHTDAATGGTLAFNTAYYYRVSALNAWGGETLASTETSVTTANDAVNTHKVTVNWNSVAGAKGYRVYGRTTGAEQLLITVGQVTSFVDTGAITPNGPLPTANTTGNTTASAGPADWSTATNWSRAAIPTASEDVVIESSSQSILYGLVAGVTLTSLRVLSTFTGNLGLPPDQGNYSEYRAQYLLIGATTVKVGEGAAGGQGSQRLKLDTYTVQAAITVYLTGRGSETGLEPFLWKGWHASNALEAYGDSEVGIAVLAGEVADVSGGVSLAGSAKVRAGSGVTLSSSASTPGWQQGGSNTVGQFESNVGLAILTREGGVLSILAGNVTTRLEINGGRCYYRGTGTITLLQTADDGVIDFSQDGSARTVTNANFYGGQYVDPFESVTFSNTARVYSGNWRCDRGNAYGIQFAA